MPDQPTSQTEVEEIDITEIENAIEDIRNEEKTYREEIEARLSGIEETLFQLLTLAREIEHKAGLRSIERGEYYGVTFQDN